VGSVEKPEMPLAHFGEDLGGVEKVRFVTKSNYVLA
jgi:hypothetical protein